MQILIQNEWPKGKFNETLLNQRARKILSALDCEDGELSVVLCDDDTIAELHGRYFNDPTPTNVISFAQGEGEFAEVEPQYSEWCEHAPTGDQYPSAFGLTYRETAVAVDQTRLLLGDFVADVQEFNSSLERWLYRTFTGNPVEYKLLSRVRVGAGQDDALAAHEWVRWGRGRDRPERRALPP